MAKNLIPEIAKMLGVELGEEFKVKGDDELTYRFTNAGLKLTHDSGIELADVSAKVAFADLVNGKDEIVKLPWKPKKGDTFYSFRCLGSALSGYGYIPEKSDYTWRVDKCTWNDSAVAFALYKAGWIFRTREGAEAALPKVAAELGVDYEL